MVISTHHEGLVERDDETAIKSVDIETAVNVSPPPSSAHVGLSRDIVEFLKLRQEVPHEVLTRPLVRPPIVAESLPLSHYFISTSHNTYLLSCQLLGTAVASAYTRILSHACRCVEIDVWLRQKAPPSLLTVGPGVITSRFGTIECHVPVDRQDIIVHIMREVWGDKLVDKVPEGYEGKINQVSPGVLRGSILLLVEYYPSKRTGQENLNTLSESDFSQQEVKVARPLAALGIYGRSIKPGDEWLQLEPTEPQHILYNLSEGALGKLIPESLRALTMNSLSYMRRVYPKGTRITSNNFVPLKHWGSGTQVVALNWQCYDLGLQFNEAMFTGTGGWVVKPDRLRGVKPFDERRAVRLSCELVGGCNNKLCPQIYVYAELYFPSGEKTWKSQVRHPSSPAESSHAEMLLNEKFHWEYLEDDLTFVRLSVYQEEWGKDDRLGTFCARVDYLQPGLRFMRLFDKRGCHNGGLLLVKFDQV